MKKELKAKAKSLTAERAQKRMPKSRKAAAKRSAAGASEGASAKAKRTSVRAETMAPKTKAAKAEPAEKHNAKRKRPGAEAETPAAKSRKRPVRVKEEREFRINEPVLDPIGDVISGEARTYLGDTESQGRVETTGQEEIDAYREETEIAAVDGTLEDDPETTAREDIAAGGMNQGDGEDSDEDERLEDAPSAEQAKLERLQKILSQAGIASRRRAEEMIVAGRVMVNGQVVTQLGSKADPARDHIRVDGKLLHGAERHRYFVLNKPKGYVTTVSDPEGRPTVMEFFSKMSERLYPVGRLDFLSEGLLLMTNDGELANLLSKAGSGVEKVYLVKVAGQPTEEELERLRKGVAIERGEQGSERVRTAPARIRQVRVGDNPWYEVVLTEGRNRELRKMFAAIGHFAEKIRRVGYGPLALDVEPGKLRELTADEVNALRLTAEGKMKPRRMRGDFALHKEAGKPAEQQRRFAKQFDRERRDRPQRENIGPKKDWKSQGGKFGKHDRRKEFSGERREGTGPKKEWRPRNEGSRGGPRREFGGGNGESRGGPRREFGSGPRREFRSGPPQERRDGRFERPQREFRGGAPRKEFGRKRGSFDKRGDRSDTEKRRPFKPRAERPAFDRGDRKPFERSSFEKRGRFRGEGQRRFEGSGKSFGKGARFGARAGGFGDARGGGQRQDGRGKNFGKDRGGKLGGPRPGSKPGAARGGWKRG